MCLTFDVQASTHDLEKVWPSFGLCFYRNLIMYRKCRLISVQNYKNCVDLIEQGCLCCFTYNFFIKYITNLLYFMITQDNLTQ
jgi:hypothetical protein